MDILPPLSEEDRMLSGLCYPFWPAMSPMVLLGSRRDEPFVHFHALQALALGLVSTGGSLLLVLFIWLTLKVLPGSSPTFSGVVGLGVFTFGFCSALFYLSFLLYTAWRAAEGRFLRLPFLGAWAEARMQASLGLAPEDYSFEPLPRREAEDFEEAEAIEDVDPALLTRMHRPPVRASAGPRPAEEPVAQPRRWPSQEFSGGPEASEPRRGGPPEDRVPEEGEDFQPGLFPAAVGPGSRKVRWEPLDPEDDESPRGGGFQSW